MPKERKSYKYSIIIPHHNIPDLLERCLSTIPKFDDIQVIVVDDTSSIENVNKIKILEQKYDKFEFLYTQMGKGAGYARNIGLEKVKGEWLLFFDADDYIDRNSYYLWESVLRTSYDYDIIFFKVTEVKDRTVIIERIKNKPNILDKYLRYCYTQPWGKLFSSKFIKENKIQFEDSLVANDYYFSVLSGFKARKIKYIDDYFYHYIQREGSLCYNILEDYNRIESRLIVYDKIEKFFKSKNIHIHPCSNFLSKCYRQFNRGLNKKLKVSMRLNNINGYNLFSLFLYGCVLKIFEKILFYFKIPYYYI